MVSQATSRSQPFIRFMTNSHQFMQKLGSIVNMLDKEGIIINTIKLLNGILGKVFCFSDHRNIL